MPQDARSRLAEARRIYAHALAERNQFAPGEPGYRDAVHRAGVAWTSVIYWERRVDKERQREPG